MRLQVLFFAAARDAAGTSETSVEMPHGATVADLFERLAAENAALRDILGGCRAAVDEEFAPSATPIRDGQTVAILPPVSGG